MMSKLQTPKDVNDWLCALESDLANVQTLELQGNAACQVIEFEEEIIALVS
jgi:hypothetical protein